MHQILQYIEDEAGNKTKHNQIIDGILRAIADKVLQPGDKLPSVNFLFSRLQFARMTIVKALHELKDRGVIESENRIGYFVKNSDFRQNTKIMLFLTEFNVYHETLYNAIKNELNDEGISIDLYFHFCNPLVVKSVLTESRGLYSLYIITPFDNPQLGKCLSDIPAKKLLQIIRPPVRDDASFIGQSFSEQVLSSLKSIRNRLSYYKKFILVFPENEWHPEIITKAFSEFCREAGIEFDIISRIQKNQVKLNHAYFVIKDRDLIDLVKFGEEKGYTPGESIGILSFNDTPMKEIIRNGITVISTDFAAMGRSVGEFIKTRQAVRKTIPTRIKLRNSL